MGSMSDPVSPPSSAIQGVRLAGSLLCVGADTTHGDLADSTLVRSVCPILGSVAALAQARQPDGQVLAVLGGPLFHPYMPALLALDARFSVRHGQADVLLSSDTFFGPNHWPLTPRHELAELRVPTIGTGVGMAFERLAPAHEGGPEITAGVVLRTWNRVVSEARVAVLTGGDLARLTELEEELVGKPASDRALAGVAQGSASTAQFPGVAHLVVQVVEQAVRRAAQTVA